MTGRAPALVVAWPNGVVDADLADLDPGATSPTSPSGTPHVGHTELRHGEPGNYDWTVKKTQAAQAMKQFDIALPAARAFVEEAAQQLPRSASVEQLIRRALRVFRESQPAFATRVR